MQTSILMNTPTGRYKEKKNILQTLSLCYVWVVFSVFDKFGKKWRENVSSARLRGPSRGSTKMSRLEP